MDVAEGTGIPGAVAQEHAVWLSGEHFFRTGGAGDHVHHEPFLTQTAEDVAFDAEVETNHVFALGMFAGTNDAEGVGRFGPGLDFWNADAFDEVEAFHGWSLAGAANEFVGGRGAEGSVLCAAIADGAGEHLVGRA